MKPKGRAPFATSTTATSSRSKVGYARPRGVFKTAISSHKLSKNFFRFALKTQKSNWHGIILLFSLAWCDVKKNPQELQCEIGLITDQMDRVSRHGQLICQRTRDEHEQQLVRTTLSNLTDQLQQVRSWLEEKKLQVRPTDPILSLPNRLPLGPRDKRSPSSHFHSFVPFKVGDSIDSWQRFLQLHALVIAWVDEKKGFLAEPLHLISLVQARQKSQDYNVL